MANQLVWNTELEVDLRSWNLGYFFQDDWKVSPRLTLNLGARYEVVLPFLDRRDRMGIFDTWTDPAKPRLIYAGAEGTDRYNRAMYATDKNNQMPRVGFVYKLTEKLIIRSGYGIFFTDLRHPASRRSSPSASPAHCAGYDVAGIQHPTSKIRRLECWMPDYSTLRGHDG